MIRKPHSQETKDKIRMTLLGRKHSPERLANIKIGFDRARLLGKVKGGKLFTKGHSPWNSGKVGMYSKERMEQLKIQAINRPQFKYSFRGKKHTPETILKISKNTKGRKLSIEVRRRLSISHGGDKTHLWRGGVDRKEYKHYKNVEYKFWREEVFKRDDFTCVLCKKRGVLLHPHHINSYTQYPQLRYLLDNGVTLCKECHFKLHQKRDVSIKESLEEYLKGRNEKKG